MKKNLLYTVVLPAVLLASCTSENSTVTQAPAAAQTTTEAPASHESHMAVANVQTQAPSSTKNLMTKEGLPKDLVCMVNNAYMGKKQVPVPFENKMYYGCCEMCVNTIQQQREVRYAVDPVTGEEVDKSQAFVALKTGGANGDVLYFASEENYHKFMQ